MKTVYDKFSKAYDFVFGYVLEDGRKQLAQMITEEQGTSLIEIGVGSGLMLPLYPSHFEILGIDLSDEMLKVAQKRAAKLAAKISLHKVDGEFSGLPNSAFDHVVLPYVYSVTPNPDRLIEESFRLCRPGGTIWILNHFSGLGGIWDIPGCLVKRVPKLVGFRSDFSYQQYVVAKDFKVEAEVAVNLLGLSRVIKIRKEH